MPLVFRMVALPHPMGALEAILEDSAWRTLYATPNCWKNPAFGPTMGRSSQSGLFYRYCRPGIDPMPHRDGYYEATPRPNRRD